MRLFRFRRARAPSEDSWPLSFQDRASPGVVLQDGRHLDVRAWGRDFDATFFERGLSELEQWLEVNGEICPVLDPTTLHFCEAVRRPSKIVAVGLNYRDHAAETSARVPTEPKIFMKATSALCGVSDPLWLPDGSTSTDYEIELAVILGRVTRAVSEAQALEHIFGFSMMNDYSEREFQKNREGQWVKGKSADTFAPLGPYLVPKGDLSSLDLELKLAVNGEVRQQARVSQMVFSVAQVVSSISQYMTLVPGDVISTGTPKGVGLGFVPPRFLREGDVVEYSIQGIGAARQRVEHRSP